jgi:hypothetical protein
MNSEHLFSQALGLPAPWQVQKVEFPSSDTGQSELHLFIDFPRGSRFVDESGALCPVHDTVPRRWQHLSFFNTPVICIVLYLGLPLLMARSSR